MSLLNIVNKGDVAWVAFDTTGQRFADGSRHPYSKAIPLVHADMLVCGRGERMFLVMVFMALIDANVADFDAAESMFAAILERAAQGYAQIAEHEGVDTAGFAVEGTLVGWSANRGQPCILVGIREAGQAGFRIRETPWYLAPEVDGGGAPVPANEIEMTCLARAQVARCRRDFPDQPIGGDLILAEVSKGEMSFRRIAELG